MDVAASEFYDNKGKTYDLNFKEEVDNLWNFSWSFSIFIPLVRYISSSNALAR